MEEMKIISDYLHIDEYRKSFNQLSEKTFRLDFEPWYQAGFFHNRYIPYSCLYKGEIIANASISFVDLIMDHQPVKAIQIGTVMTDKKYRNRGLAKQLMERIISDYEDKYDFIYLFANDKVLNFYPKFGFKKVNEKSYSMSTSHILNQDTIIKVLNPDREQDKSIIKNLIENRKPVSRKLGVVNDLWPLSTSCLDHYCDFLDRYHFVNEDIIVLARRNKGVLDLYDVISQTEFDLDEIVEKMVAASDHTVEFHFIPELKKYQVLTSTASWEDDTLFVKSKRLITQDLLFPLTSHT